VRREFGRWPTRRVRRKPLRSWSLPTPDCAASVSDPPAALPPRTRLKTVPNPHPPSNADAKPRGLLARKLLPGGTEPDPRFTLANERTFLAWIRTSLAFLAGGIAIEAFADGLFTRPIREGLSILLLLIGMQIGAGAAFRWLSVERSMRAKTPLPLPLIVPLLALGGAVAASAIIFQIVQT
jgi:putative membrane protein